MSLGRCGPQDLLGLRKDVFHWSIVYQGGREFSFIYKSKRRIREETYTRNEGYFACLFVCLNFDLGLEEPNASALGSIGILNS